MRADGKVASCSPAAVRALRAFIAFVFCAAMLASPVDAWAMMGGGSSEGGSSSSMPQGEGEVVGTSDYDGVPATAEEGEQLGLMPRLYRLTGQTTASDDPDGLITEGVGALFPNLLTVSTTPTSINTGIECTNNDFCLIDPCTCGKPDAWGHCACGGFRETVPSVTIEVGDDSVAKVVEALGQTWLVPVSPGMTTVTVTAKLVHFKDATYSFNVQVAPLGVMDVLLVAAALLIVAAAIALVAIVVRLIVRFVKKRLATRRKWRQRGIQLQEEHPLTWRAKLASECYAQSHGGRRRRAGVRMPFLHDVLFSLRQALPVLLAGLAVFAVLVPASTSLVNDFSVFNVNYTHEQLKYQLYAQDLAPFVNAASVLYGAVLAITLFRFLLKKRSTTAFFSVGLSRVKLFLSRFIAGVACIVVGIGVPFALSLLLNTMALELYWGQIAEFFYVTCGYMLVAAVSFALAAVAVVCAGTLFEAVVFSAALLCSVTVVLWGVGVLAEHLLAGNAAGAVLYGQSASLEPSYLESLAGMNPLLFFADEGAAHQFFMALHPVYYPQLGDWRFLAVWFVVFLALSAAGLLLLCDRDGERAEMAGKSPVLSLFSVAVAGLAAFSAAVALLGPVDIVVAVVAGTALFALVSLLLMFGPLRGRTSRNISLACAGGELAAMLATVAIVATGAFGFSGYVPSTDEVESVEVSYAGSPSYLTEGFSGVSSGESYYYTSYRTYSDPSSIDIVRQAHAQLAETAHARQGVDEADYRNTVLPYDLVIRYTLKDGGTVARYYDQATVAELSSLLQLDDDARSRDLERAVMTGDTEGLSDEDASALTDSPSYNAYRTGTICVADGSLSGIAVLECSDQERAALLEALAQDTASLGSQERYAPSKQPIAAVMFTLSPQVDLSSFGYSFSNAVSYVTEDWTSTVAWLRANGYGDVLEGLDAADVESLTLVQDDPFSEDGGAASPTSRYFMGYRGEEGEFWFDTGSAEPTVIEDPSRIERIVPELRLGCFMDGGCLVQAKLSGSDACVYYYLPAEAAAECLE